MPRTTRPTGLPRRVLRALGVEERCEGKPSRTVLKTSLGGDTPAEFDNDYFIASAEPRDPSNPGDDDDGHGTHVAGIAAALDNAIGVVGVAPGARLWGLKVLDADGFGTTSDVIAAIDFVTSRAAEIEVANLSLGTISAFGDSDGRGGGEGPPRPNLPSDNALASFSNYSGSVDASNPFASPGAAIDLAAPGVEIYSTERGGRYSVSSGTSMTAPHSAGAVALYIATHTRATDAAGVHAIRQALIDSAIPQTNWGAADTNDPDTNRQGLVSVPVNAALNDAPHVRLTSPADGAGYAEGTAVTLSGYAADAESGTLDGSIAWTSSVDGAIGTGPSVEWTASAGVHTVTASIADAQGKASQETAIIIVPPHAPDATVATDKSTYRDGETVLITGTVTDGGAPVQDAECDHISVIKWSGNTYHLFLFYDTTDAEGKCTAQYTVDVAQYGKGTYEVHLIVHKFPYDEAGAQTTFKVR